MEIISALPKCGPFDLARLFDTRNSVIILDTRSEDAFNRICATRAHCVNLPLDKLSFDRGMAELQEQMKLADRVQLRRWNKYAHIVILFKPTDTNANIQSIQQLINFLKNEDLEASNRILLAEIDFENCPPRLVRYMSTFMKPSMKYRSPATVCDQISQCWIQNQRMSNLPVLDTNNVQESGNPGNFEMTVLPDNPKRIHVPSATEAPPETVSQTTPANRDDSNPMVDLEKMTAAQLAEYKAKLQEQSILVERITKPVVVIGSHSRNENVTPLDTKADSNVLDERDKYMRPGYCDKTRYDYPKEASKFMPMECINEVMDPEEFSFVPVSNPINVTGRENNRKKSSGLARRPYGAPQHSGLENLGNTCYMNSVMQCLFSIEQLKQFLLTDAYKNDVNVTNRRGYLGKLVEATANLFKLLNNKNARITPRYFLKIMRACFDTFNNSDMHDAHEFYTSLMNGISEDVNRVKDTSNARQQLYDNLPPEYAAVIALGNMQSVENSFIADLFNGMAILTNTCKTCSTQTYRFEPFGCLSVNIPRSSCTVKECMREDYGIESMAMLECGKCKKQTPTMQKRNIWSFSSQLILHLKRFQFGENNVIKSSANVTFPVDEPLDISEFLARPNNNARFSLVAVSNHHGSINVGHYISYCKRENEWLCFDDANVTLISSSLVQTADAYLLFYKAEDNTS